MAVERRFASHLQHDLSALCPSQPGPNCVWQFLSVNNYSQPCVRRAATILMKHSVRLRPNSLRLTNFFLDRCYRPED